MRFKKGHTPWNKNKICPSISKARKGIKFSVQHKKSIKEVVKKFWQDPNYRKHMSKAHKGQHSSPATEIKKGSRGEKSLAWKNGTITNTQGYIYIFNPEHPFATKAGYVRRSRLVIEKKLGRHLKPKEVVHHKGMKYPIKSTENRQDDRLENLKLFPNNSKHMKFHKKLRRIYKSQSTCTIKIV